MARRGAFTHASYKFKIVAGAATIGSSIWSMHFIAMLALGLRIPVEYDSLVTTISVFVAIVLTGLGLYAAIAGMHCMGMSAIRTSCLVTYAPLGVAGSILIGVAVSTLAL
jgi:NO-binding membrane sensor protein with MHYT domain